jgi:hypothetical protein
MTGKCLEISFYSFLASSLKECSERDNACDNTNMAGRALSIIEHYIIGLVWLFIGFVWVIGTLLCNRRRLHRNGALSAATSTQSQSLDVEESRQILGRIMLHPISQQQQHLQSINTFEEEEDAKNSGSCMVVVDLSSQSEGNHAAMVLPILECNICLERYRDGDLVRKSLACDHIFHRTCITEWLERGKMECPSCRTPFVNLPSPETSSELSLQNHEKRQFATSPSDVSSCIQHDDDRV